MTYKAAIRKVERHLLKNFGTGFTQVKIYDWANGDIKNVKPSVGPRVSEVSFSSWNVDGTGHGCSFMACDPDGLAVCAQVERYIVALINSWRPEEIAEELDRLNFLLRPHKDTL